MLYSPAFTFSSGYPLGFCRVPGFAFGRCVSFKSFLASSPCVACTTSYHFSSSASLPWRTAFSRFAPVVNSVLSVLASGSNCAVKPTCLRQAAYFRSLGMPMRLRYFLDWGGDILWAGDDEANAKYGYPADLDLLPISHETRELIKRLFCIWLSIAQGSKS